MRRKNRCNATNLATLGGERCKVGCVAPDSEARGNLRPTQVQR